MTPRRADTRAVTVPTDYVLLVGITALLASGLLAGTAGFVGDQHEGALRAGLSVVGNDLAADLTTADRLADSLGDDGRASLTVDLPQSVAGTTYLVRVEDTTTPPADRTYTYDLVLTSTAPEVTVRVPLATRRPLTLETLDGGPVEIVATPGGLEVRDD